MDRALKKQTVIIFKCDENTGDENANLYSKVYFIEINFVLKFSKFDKC